MREPELKVDDRQVEERQVKKGFFHRRSIYLKPGQKVWELNVDTGILKEATYDESNYNIATKQGNRRINENPRCVYAPAINWKNAKRKLDEVFENKLLIIKESK